MSGYYRFEKPGELEPPSSEAGPGWYNTGDIVEIDAEGFLHIRGRVKRFAKVAGEMISLEVVEKLAVRPSPGQHGATTRADPSAAKHHPLHHRCRPDQGSACRKPPAPAACRRSRCPGRSGWWRPCPCWGPGKVDHVTLKKMGRCDGQKLFPLPPQRGAGGIGACQP
jgi:acyl-[acyl-carrier-protein]-phospholipid O-acyltransferase/long-chain-fatty-acid--[acyl-carrier-protein] ligase